MAFPGFPVLWGLVLWMGPGQDGHTVFSSLHKVLIVGSFVGDGDWVFRRRVMSPDIHFMPDRKSSQICRLLRVALVSLLVVSSVCWSVGLVLLFSSSIITAGWVLAAPLTGDRHRGRGVPTPALRSLAGSPHDGRFVVVVQGHSPGGVECHFRAQRRRPHNEVTVHAYPIK